MVVIVAAILLFGIGFLFYKNIIVAAVCSLFGLFAIPAYRTYMRDRRDRLMSEQFRYVLYSLSSLLAAGRSVENAFQLAEQDLRTLYAGNSLVVMPELIRVNGKVSNGETIEKALFEFGERTNQAD